MLDRLPVEAIDLAKSNSREVRIWKTSPDAWKDLLDLEGFERLLSRVPLSATAMTLYRDGAMPPAELLGSHDGESVPASRIRSLVLDDGFSAKITDVDDHEDGIAIFMRRLSRLVKRPLTANLYFTPTEAPCFKPHQDPYSVLVIQLAGRKKWWIDPESAGRPLSNAAVARAGALGREYDLEAGDVMMVPALAVHHARVIDEGPSLHLTIGFRSYKYKNLFDEILESKRTALFFDQELPLGKDGTFDVVAIAHALESMSRRLLDTASIEKFSGAMLESLSPESRQLLKGSWPRKSPLPTSTPL